MERSNEAEPDQLEVARSEGDAYAKALDAMRKEEGGVVALAGNYLHTTRRTDRLRKALTVAAARARFGVGVVAVASGWRLPLGDRGAARALGLEDT